MSRYWILVSGCWIKQVIVLSYLSGIQHPASLRFKQWDYDSHSRRGGIGLRRSFARVQENMDFSVNAKV
jgi:hypothetical protein